MFHLRSCLLHSDSLKCLPEMCKILQSRMSSSKYVSVRQLPPLSRQIFKKNVPDDELLQTPYKKKGIYRVMEMAKKGKIEDAEQLFKKLQAVPRMKFGVGVCMALFDMHIKAGNVKESVEALELLHSLHPQVILQPYKVLSCATLLLQHGQTQRCLQLLRDEAHDEGRHSPEQLKQQQWSPKSNPGLMAHMSHELIMVAAEKGEVATTQQLFDALLHHGYCEASRHLCGPLIKVHIVRADYGSALKALEEVAVKHQWLPCKAELLLSIITDSETESLTRLLELSIGVIGRPQTMFDLAVALLEADQIDKAAHILKKEKIYLEPARLRYLCKLYVSTQQPRHIQNLLSLARVHISAPEDLVMIRSHLYVCFELCGRENDARALQQELQSEGITKEQLLETVPALKRLPQNDKQQNKTTKELAQPRALQSAQSYDDEARLSLSNTKKNASYFGFDVPSERKTFGLVAKSRFYDRRREVDDGFDHSPELDCRFGQNFPNEEGDAPPRRSRRWRDAMNMW